VLRKVDRQTLSQYVKMKTESYVRKRLVAMSSIAAWGRSPLFRGNKSNGERNRFHRILKGGRRPPKSTLTDNHVSTRKWAVVRKEDEEKTVN